MMRVDKAFSQARKNESKAKSCIIMQKVNPSDEKGAEKNPEVDFVVINDSKTQSTVTEDGTELTNLYNVHMDTYEASYVAGVTAGMKVAKLKEKKKIPAKSFDEKKNVKLGYVAAEANDDAHADINAYYLGVKAVCKKVVLQVEYIDAWNNSDAEGVCGSCIQYRSGCCYADG